MIEQNFDKRYSIHILHSLNLNKWIVTNYPGLLRMIISEVQLKKEECLSII